jgi:dolichol kinase
LKDALLIFLQWPAMIATLISAWMVASQSKQKRVLGFLTFIISNFLWILWGWHDGAYALIVMQLGLLFLNIRGAVKNESKKSE